MPVVKPCREDMQSALAEWRLIPFQGKGLGIDFGMDEGQRQGSADVYDDASMAMPGM